jgi:hypothetical protein
LRASSMLARCIRKPSNVADSKHARARAYVGVRRDLRREVFKATRTPTRKRYGRRYTYVVGPFKTVQGARFMADYGANNPHCTCVAQAEWLAKHHVGDHTRRRPRL